jgi:hypothetical protein
MDVPKKLRNNSLHLGNALLRLQIKGQNYIGSIGASANVLPLVKNSESKTEEKRGGGDAVVSD